MKALLLILVSMFMVNCGGKDFSASTVKATDDNTIHDDNHDDDNNDDDDDNDDDHSCPRYDLVVISTDTANSKLNFTYKYNGEMTHTAVSGKHHIQFTNSHYTSCSGDYTNSTYSPSLIPLKVTEDLTGEVLMTHGKTCGTSTRKVNIQVVDSATNKLLFNEIELKEQMGCEFGYTDAGKALRTQLIGLADAVASAKGASCN